MEISRHFETVPRLCPTETRKRRNLPPLPFGVESQTLEYNNTDLNSTNTNNLNTNNNMTNGTNVIINNNIGSSSSSSGVGSNKKELPLDYIVAEKIQVPLTSSLLKPILKTLGRLQMQIWNNCKEAKLALTINQASNLQVQCVIDGMLATGGSGSGSSSSPTTAANGGGPSSAAAAVANVASLQAPTTGCSSSSSPPTSFILIVGRMVFEEQATRTFRTNPVPCSSKPVWNETFLFEYNESVEDATLEVCAHETKSANDLRLLRDTFLGMIILPLSEANLEDEPRWYELRVRLLRSCHVFVLLEIFCFNFYK